MRLHKNKFAGYLVWLRNMFPYFKKMKSFKKFYNNIWL